jgi:uncharacterized coiled-coil DUF342 family protein
MTTINDITNEVINLSPPQEWLYKCDCPQCRVGAHYNKDIADSYRKRGELNNEVARLRDERDKIQKNLDALAGFFYRAMQIVEGFRVTLETVTDGEVECKQLKELRQDIEAHTKANKPK